MEFLRVIGIKQSVQVDDDKLDIGFIDTRLASAAPSLQGRLMIGIEADDFKIVYIDEVGALRVSDFAAEDKMQ